MPGHRAKWQKLNANVKIGCWLDYRAVHAAAQQMRIYRYSKANGHNGIASAIALLESLAQPPHPFARLGADIGPKRMNARLFARDSINDLATPWRRAPPLRGVLAAVAKRALHPRRQ